jgi:hypothetical protein
VTARHLLSTRPIFHKLDETIRGHVFCSFLALVLKKALEDRIAALGRSDAKPRPRLPHMGPAARSQLPAPPLMCSLTSRSSVNAQVR